MAGVWSVTVPAVLEAASMMRAAPEALGEPAVSRIDDVATRSRTPSPRVVFTDQVTITLTDSNGYWSGGSFGGYVGMFYKYFDPGFNEGDEFDATMEIHPREFPNNTVIAWRVPDVSPTLGVGVYGYQHVDFGNYAESSVEIPITSRQVYTITRLTVNLKFRWDETLVDTDGSNLLEEVWLTSSPTSAGETHTLTSLWEVGCFRRHGPSCEAYVSASTPIGTYNDGTRDWTVVIDKIPDVPYIMFMPDGEVQGLIDWQAHFAYLIKVGAISGNEWFNGIGTGVEHRTGSGILTIETLDVDYAGAVRMPWSIDELRAVPHSNTSIELVFLPAAGATRHQYRQDGGSWTSLPRDSVIRGLAASAAYEFEVRGVNATGAGTASKIATGTTKKLRK